MITTPEQMREAAARLADIAAKTLAKNAPTISRDTGVNQMFADLASAIRAIPIAPQPMAVTVKPLVWDAHGEAKGVGAKYCVYEVRDGWNCACYPYDDDHYRVATAVPELLAKAAAQADYEARILSALTIHPADPLSDPRVVALVHALKTTRDRLASLAHDQFDGVWSASDFEDETREAEAAIRAIGGDA